MSAPKSEATATKSWKENTNPGHFLALEKEGKVLTRRNLRYLEESPLWFSPAGVAQQEFKPARPKSAAILTIILEGTAAFTKKFQVAELPVNPKTGQPFGKDTKTSRDWAAANGVDLDRALTMDDTADIHQAVSAFNSSSVVRKMTEHDNYRTGPKNFLGDLPSAYFPIPRLNPEGKPLYIWTTESMNDVVHASKAGYRVEALAFMAVSIDPDWEKETKDQTVEIGTHIVIEERFPYRVMVEHITLEAAAYQRVKRTVEFFHYGITSGKWNLDVKEAFILLSSSTLGLPKYPYSLL